MAGRGKAGMSEDGRAGSGPPPVLRPRTFWVIFTAAWSAYAALTASTGLMQGGSLPASILGAFTVVMPLALPAIVVAARRKSLLRPRGTTLGTSAQRVGIGVVYALTVASLGSALVVSMPAHPLRSELGDNTLVTFGAFFLSALFLFTVLLVFLLWLDALERVQESRSLAAQEAVLRAEAEAKSVRAQFNPHFVFNTLHTLLQLVRMDPDTAERAIEDVAGLIRYASTLQRHEIDQVSLEKEMEFAERYVSLERLRLGDRLTVGWEVDRALLDVMLPAFSLQTLLENAIKHGISPKPEGGTVEITVAEDAGRVTLRVEDDGQGADAGAVADTGGSGLGLLQRRLESVYEGEASVEWSTAPDEGFAATVRLPIRRASGTEPTA